MAWLVVDDKKCFLICLQINHSQYYSVSEMKGRDIFCAYEAQIEIKEVESCAWMDDTR
jgi:hypothetical protein